MSYLDYNNDMLDRARKRCDNHADEFILKVINKHELTELNSFFRRFVYNNQIDNDIVPDDFRNYIRDNSQLPDWADKSKIELAEETFTRIGPDFVVSYLLKSLPECYACGKGAEVLYKTGRLTTHTRRRIAQTAQFVLDVMSPGGLSDSGRGIATSLKVRLMHASIRYYFLEEVRQGRIEFDAEYYGMPINQEDLLGTLLAFSCVVLNGVEKIGILVTNEEKEAVLHLWKCVGYLIGIEEKLLPENHADAVKLWDLITVRHFEKTKAGEALTNIHIEFLDELIPKRIFFDIIPLMMKILVGKKTMALLNVREPKIYNPFAIVSFILGILLLKLESQGFLSRITSKYVNMKLLNALEKYIAEGENTSIYIPPDLRHDWQIDNPLKSIFNRR